MRERGYEPTNPWYFPTIGEYAGPLEDHGIEVTFTGLFNRPMEFEGRADGLADWLTAFGDGLLSTMPSNERDAAVADVEERFREDRFR
ncbi:hypothetical protein [Natronorubrum sp. DTA7]|uniref:hypothetical protein n=1 Tax=Natronorubrum sp. DTA7 TaxID=3447016 RepID=UPI003F842DD9